jgi:hypothetical protein
MALLRVVLEHQIMEMQQQVVQAELALHRQLLEHLFFMQAVAEALATQKQAEHKVALLAVTVAVDKVDLVAQVAHQMVLLVPKIAEAVEAVGALAVVAVVA